MFAKLNHPLGLWQLPHSASDFYKLMLDGFKTKKTLVLLDTNILGTTFRLHAQARRGLYRLLRRPILEKRLIVPAWASNEYFYRAFKQNPNQHAFVDGAKDTLLKSLPSSKQVKSVLTPLLSSSEAGALAAKLGVKEDSLYGEIASRVEAVRSIFDAVGKELSPEQVHEELMQEITGDFPSLDFGKHLAEVSSQAESRRLNRIAPGLTDITKRKRQIDEPGAQHATNEDGDLAIWLEMLAIAKDRRHVFDSVLILTQETKEDFYYRPRSRLAEAAKAAATKNPYEANRDPEILVIDARMVSEFQSRVGHRSVAMANLLYLAESALSDSDYVDPEVQADISSLLLALKKESVRPAAVQATPGRPHESPEVGDDSNSQDVATERDGSENLPIPTPQVPEDSRTRPASDDGAVGVGGLDVGKDGSGSLDTAPGGSVTHENERRAIAEFSSLDWASQNRVIQRLRMRPPRDDRLAFALGRQVFHAASTSSVPAAARLLEATSKIEQPDRWQQALVAGALIEAFLDEAGRLRASFVGKNLADLVPAIEGENWSLARRLVHERLEPYRASFYALPGEQPLPTQVSVMCEGQSPTYILRSATFMVAGRNALELVRPAKNQSEKWLRTRTTDVAAIVDTVSRRTLNWTNIQVEVTPPTAIDAQLIMEGQTVLDARVGRVPLSGAR